MTKCKDCGKHCHYEGGVEKCRPPEYYAKPLHAAMEAMGDRTVLVSPTPVTPREAAPDHTAEELLTIEKALRRRNLAQLAEWKKLQTETLQDLAGASQRTRLLEGQLAAAQEVERSLLAQLKGQTESKELWIASLKAQLEEISKLTGRMEGEAVIESVARLKSALIRRLGQNDQMTEMALRNLMARIHRDGGQRQDTFPSLIEAAKDCENIVVAGFDSQDRIKKALDLLEKHDSCQHTRFVERAIRALRDP